MCFCHCREMRALAERVTSVRCQNGRETALDGLNWGRDSSDTNELFPTLK